MSEPFTGDFEHASCASAVGEVTHGERAFHGPVCEECLASLREKFASFIDAVGKLIALGEADTSAD